MYCRYLGELINPRIEKRLSAEQRMADVHLISWDRGTNMLLRPELYRLKM